MGIRKFNQLDISRALVFVRTLMCDSKILIVDDEDFDSIILV